MSIEKWMQLLSSGILAASVAYLIARILKQIIVQRRSYRDLPFDPSPSIITADDDALDRAAAAMLGLAIGDALGMPRESVPVWLANLRFGRTPAFSHGIIRFMRQRGTVSDDTQLTVATARAIRDDGSYADALFKQGLSDWAARAIGPGRATLRAARGWRAGEDRRDMDSQGNGAAMRVVPLAIAFRAHPERLRDAVRINAASTHPNTDAVIGAEVMAKLIAWLLAQNKNAKIDSKILADAILPAAPRQNFEDWQIRLRRAAQGAEGGDTLAEIGITGWVKHTVPAVVFMLATHGDKTDPALRELWALGGDIDTIAALYLACIGALRGTSIFDAELLTSVQGRAVLIAQASRLHAVSTYISRPHFSENIFS